MRKLISIALANVPTVTAVLSAVAGVGAAWALLSSRVEALEGRCDSLEATDGKVAETLSRIDRRVAGLSCKFLSDCK